MKQASGFSVFFFIGVLVFGHSATDVMGAPIQTNAEFAILMDAETAVTLYEKRSDELMAPASMSKLMTLAILFDRLKNTNLTLEDSFPVSRKAWRTGGSKMFVLVDTDIKIEDLIRGIIVHSGNDACVVVAEGISGTEEAFANEMTRFAREKLGLRNATFVNSHGLPPEPGQEETLMTARELALLARHLIYEYPDYYTYFAETEFSWDSYGKDRLITQSNRNPLLYLNIGADGLKTGSTEKSGYGLTSSAVEGSRRLILVVNGLGSPKVRSTESQRLLRIGFRDFKSYELFESGAIVGEAEVWQGATGRVPLTIQDPVKLILQPDERDKMRVTINYEGPVAAPIAAGQQIAELRIETPNRAAIVQPLYAAESVPPMGIGGRLGSALIHLIRSSLSGGE